MYWETDGVFEILERPRQAVQRADCVASREHAVGLIREREALVVVQLRDDGVERRVEAVDAGEMCGHHLAGGNLAGADQRGEFTPAGVADVAASSRVPLWRFRCALSVVRCPFGVLPLRSLSRSLPLPAAPRRGCNCRMRRISWLLRIDIGDLAAERDRLRLDARVEIEVDAAADDVGDRVGGHDARRDRA